MQVKFNQDVVFNGKYYYKDDTLEVTKENIDKIWNLNEKGFITPITYKEFLKAKEKLSKEMK